nr:immunoglobulin heavy chain junction region [Mus musculus]
CARVHGNSAWFAYW